MTIDRCLHFRAKDNNDGHGANGDKDGHFDRGDKDGDNDDDAMVKEIIGYTDSDWANDNADRKSQGGHVFLCNGGAILWQSRKQDLVASSTTEAEYIACSEASREAR